MNIEEFEKLPRENRWSYSRINSFSRCPRKHHYSYKEELRGKSNIHIKLGDYFHRILDAHHKGEDVEAIIKKYEEEARVGSIEHEEELMRHVYNEYVSWYEPDDVMYTEQEFIEEWENGDYIIAKVDLIRRHNELVIARDTKTTTKKFKHDIGSVRHNQQLLLYKPIIEEGLGITVDGVEIDEVRLDICRPPLINKNGRPTADVRKLGNVKHETYLNTLKSMGLEKAEEYQKALGELAKRGHPLFNRVTIDCIDDKAISENLNDLYGFYKLAKTGCKSRVRSILCDYCEFRLLCDAEYTDLDDEGRQFIVDKIVKNS